MKNHDNVKTFLQQSVNQQIRRSTAEGERSTRYPSLDCVLISWKGERESFYHVLNHKDKEWIKAMYDELNSSKKNNIFDLVEFPKGRKTLRNKLGLIYL